jgi:hypothetical protein
LSEEVAVGRVLLLLVSVDVAASAGSMIDVAASAGAMGDVAGCVVAGDVAGERYESLSAKMNASR